MVKAKNSQNEREPEKKLKSVWASPWFGVAGVLIGLVGIVIAVVFYMGVQKERELVYTISPISTAVVSAGEASELEILHKGKQISGVDITAVQVAIWNAGKQSIRQDNILEDIVIFTEPTVQILEASVRVRSRDVTGFTLHDTPQSLEEGKVPISWQILEKNDGGSVQLIYAGSQKIKIGVKGTIEGLHGIKLVEIGVKIKTPTEQIREQQQNQWVFGIMALFFGVFSILTVFLAFIRPRQQRDLLIVVACLASFGVSLWQFLSITRVPWPPFGF
jgi:hypothetical protein